MKAGTALTLLLVLLYLPGGALAHRVNVFAWVEDGLVMGEAEFSGGKAAVNSEIVVFKEPGGEKLLSVVTDEDGAFSFAPPEEVLAEGSGLKLMLKAGAGHQDSWLVRAEELAGAAATGRPSAAPDDGPGMAEAVLGVALLLGLGGVASWIRRRAK